MDCNQIRQEMEFAFDEGRELDGPAMGHLLQCDACAAYDRALRALDGSLRHADPLQPDAALVARIQAAVAHQPRRQPRAWLYPGLAAVAVLVLAALGGVVDWTPIARNVSVQAWMPDEPILPDTVFLKQELAGIPDAVSTDMKSLSRAVEANWVSLRGWQASATGSHNPLVWALFLVCIAAACALDGREWMTRRINRPGHG